MFRLSPTFIRIKMDKELQPSSSQNDITGDHIITGVSNEAYRSGYDRIFGKKKDENLPEVDTDKPAKGYYDWSEDKPRNRWVR